MPWIFAVCEDEKVYREALNEMIRKWASARQHQVTVHSFVDTGKLLGAWSDTNSFNALILDIELPHSVDGLTFAESVRRKDRDIPIIFVTNHSDLIAKGYSVEALDFIIKPVNEEQFFIALDRLAYRLEQMPVQYFNCRVERENMRFPLRDIYFFVNEGHYVMVNGNDEYRFRERVDDLQARLPKNFARIHRSIIVNLDHVFQYSTQRVVMNDAERTEHSIGKNYLDGFIKAISEYRRFF